MKLQKENTYNNWDGQKQGSAQNKEIRKHTHTHTLYMFIKSAAGMWGKEAVNGWFNKQKRSWGGGKHKKHAANETKELGKQIQSRFARNFTTK